MTNERYGYIALYLALNFEVYADNLLDAKRQAIDHFNVPKGKRHLVEVCLARVDGDTVTQEITS